MQGTAPQLALIVALLLCPALQPPFLADWGSTGGCIGGRGINGGKFDGSEEHDWQIEAGLGTRGGGMVAEGATMAAECLEVGRRLQQAMEEIESRYGVDLVLRSSAFDPPPHRALLLLARLLAGRPLTVLAVGGSISAASHLPGGVATGKGTFGEALVEWLNKVFPTPASSTPHRLIRSFLPGAGSSILHFCAGDLLPALWTDGEEQRRAAAEADVVLLECAANDWSLLQPGMAPLPEGFQYKGAEGLLRQQLQLASHPLVLFLNFGVHHPDDPLLSSFHHSSERLLNQLSAYYSVPAVSPWRAYFPAIATASSPTCPASSEFPSEPAAEPPAQPNMLSPASPPPTENLTFAHLFVDYVHPSPAGNRLVGSLVAHRLFHLALLYLRRHGLSLAHHHLHLDWLPHAAAPAAHTSLLCPPASLCHTCLGFSGSSLLGPPLSAPCMLPPLQSAADPHPRCVLGRRWQVTSVGEEQFPEGYAVVREAAERGDASSVRRVAAANRSWVMEQCGPLVPQIFCWKAQAAGAPLRIALNVKGVTQGVGVVYKMMDWEKKEHKLDGATVLINGRDVGFLEVPIMGNKLTHWRLNSSLIPLEDGETRDGNVTLTIVPRTKWFHMVALVLE